MDEYVIDPADRASAIVYKVPTLEGDTMLEVSIYSEYISVIHC